LVWLKIGTFTTKLGGYIFGVSNFGTCAQHEFNFGMPMNKFHLQNLKRIQKAMKVQFVDMSTKV